MKTDKPGLRVLPGRNGKKDQPVLDPSKAVIIKPDEPKTIEDLLAQQGEPILFVEAQVARESAMLALDLNAVQLALEAIAPEHPDRPALEALQVRLKQQRQALGCLLARLVARTAAKRGRPDSNIVALDRMVGLALAEEDRRDASKRALQVKPAE